MSNGSTPTFREFMDTAIEGWLLQVHTAMPGTIVSYDAATGLAKVQPGFKRVYNDVDEPVNLPIIPGVPVVVMGTVGAWLRFPVQKGDTVMLHFAERALGPWLERGGQVDPLDDRRFSLKDAIAVVGLRPNNAAVKPVGAADSVELAFGRARLELTKDGGVKLGNDFAELFTTMDTILGHLIALSTTNAVVGAPSLLSAASIAQLTADRALLAKIKG